MHDAYKYRDFANGFLVAEVLSKYFPDDVQMHSFENVTSIERKRSNWHLLKKFFKVRRCRVRLKRHVVLVWLGQTCSLP